MERGDLVIRQVRQVTTRPAAHHAEFASAQRRTGALGGGEDSYDRGNYFCFIMYDRDYRIGLRQGQQADYRTSTDDFEIDGFRVVQ